MLVLNAYYLARVSDTYLKYFTEQFNESFLVFLWRGF